MDPGLTGYSFAGGRNRTDPGMSLGVGVTGPPAALEPSGFGLSPGRGVRYLHSVGQGSLGGPVPA